VAHVAVGSLADVHAAGTECPLSANDGPVHCKNCDGEGDALTTDTHGTRVPGGGALHSFKSGPKRSAVAIMLNIDLRITPML
jgi:hypothetical protein